MEEIMQFNEIKLIEPLLRTIEEIGFTKTTPIQGQTIPVLLKGNDVLACAQTGTGKTAAYALPMLQNLSNIKGKKIKGLIVTPTRELAIQIQENFDQFGKRLKLRTTVIYGGVGQSSQVNALKSGVDILVATPGRLNDLIGQGYVKLDSVKMVVLDEADQMLDMGFIHDMKKIIAKLPTERQTLMFSATMPREIETLANTILKSPRIIKVDPVTSTVDAINQTVYFVDRPNKISLLTNVIKEKEMGSVLVFTRTKVFADKVALKLNKAKIKAMAIHGDKGQTARETALRSFKDGSIKVLVATDVAARGIDISELNYVINYDIPDTPETYIHRIGRTGRAGDSGNAINFCNFDDIENLRAIEKHIGKMINEEVSAWPMLILEKSERKPRNQNKSTNQSKSTISQKKHSMPKVKTEVNVKDKAEEENRTPYTSAIRTTQDNVETNGKKRSNNNKNKMSNNTKTKTNNSKIAMSKGSNNKNTNSKNINNKNSIKKGKNTENKDSVNKNGVNKNPVPKSGVPKSGVNKNRVHKNGTNKNGIKKSGVNKRTIKGVR